MGRASVAAVEVEACGGVSVRAPSLVARADVASRTLVASDGWAFAWGATVDRRELVAAFVRGFPSRSGSGRASGRAVVGASLGGDAVVSGGSTDSVVGGAPFKDASDGEVDRLAGPSGIA